MRTHRTTTFAPRSRRFALIAAAALVGLAACGSPAEPQATGDSVPAPAVIQLAGAAGGGAEGGAKVAASEAAADASSFESMLAASIRYSFAGDVPALGGTAGSWFFAPDQEPDSAKVEALAAAFGVTGELQAQPADVGGGWIVGPNDFSGPSVNVSASGLLDWWFSPGPLPELTVEDCAVPAASEGGDTAATDVARPICASPEPPAGVPTADEARAKAEGIMQSIGLDPAAHEFEVYADEWGASVTAYLLLDGLRSPIATNFGFGGDGVLTWAGGVLATPQRGADYPRLSGTEALERLQAEADSWMTISARASIDPAVGAPEPALVDPAIDPATSKVAPCPTPLEAAVSEPAVDAATDDAVSTGDATTTGGDDALPPPIDPATLDSVLAPIEMDCEVVPMDPEPMDVVLTGVRDDLTMVWAADDTVWLLPAYTFTTDDGGLYTVNAVSDAFLEQPAPIEVAEPAPVEGDGSTGGGSAGSAGVVCVPTGSSPAVTDAPYDQWAGAELVGLCLPDAEALAAAYGHTVRVVRRDGEDLAATMDFIDTRVNVATEGDVVVEVLSKG